MGLGFGGLGLRIWNPQPPTRTPAPNISRGERAGLWVKEALGTGGRFLSGRAHRDHGLSRHDGAWDYILQGLYALTRVRV